MSIPTKLNAIVTYSLKKRVSYTLVFNRVFFNSFCVFVIFVIH